METIKSVLGLGGSASTSNKETVPAQHPLSGEEPVSGQLGAGTATDPYDAGNADGQSGSAPGQSSGSLPKASSSFESFKDNNASSLKPTEVAPSSANLESSPSAQEGFSGAPGLQGHPLPITDFSSASLAEDIAPGQLGKQIQTEDTQPQSHVPERPSDTATYSYAQREDVPERPSDTATDRYAQREDVRERPSDTATDRYAQREDVRERPSDTATYGYAQREDMSERPSDTAIHSYAQREDYPQGDTFVEREAARIAKETAPRDTTEDTGPSTSATVPDTDQDLAESTKKLHLKDKIKEKLHFRKKSEAT